MTVPSDQTLRDAGYVLATDHGADPANSDNFSQLQAWVDEVKSSNKPGYLHYHADPYLTSDSIACIHRADYRASLGAGGVPFENVQLEGGKDDSGLGRPVIKLTAGATGFGSTGDPKPMMYWNAVRPDGTQLPAPFYEVPSNPIDYPTYWTHNVGNMYGAYLRGIDLDTNGHAGAIGLIMFTAQRCWLADVKVTATGSHGGIFGWPATNCPSMNIEVEGGTTGIDFVISNNVEQLSAGAGELIVGLKISGATTPIKLTSTSCPPVIVGFEIDCASTVYTADSGQGTTTCLCLIDGRVNITGGGDPVAFDNPNDKQIYLRDVYVTGTDSLADSGSEATVTGTGTWKRIKEYVFNDPRAGSGNHQHKSASLIDGVYGTAVEPSTITENSSTDPTSLIRTRHTYVIPTIDDNFSYVDAVIEHGADNTVTTASGATSGAEIQAAVDAAETAGHNRVFLRKGNYNIEKAAGGEYGILLKANTVLFGMAPGGITFSSAGGAGTWLRPAASWEPTSQAWLIDTADTATGEIVVACMGMQLAGNKGGSPTESPPVAPLYEWFGAIRWRTNGGMLWGVPFTDQSVFRGPDEDPPTNERTAFRVTGNGAGQFYHMELNNRRWCRDTARGVVVEGASTGPCLFYGLNHEVSKGGGGGPALREMVVSTEIIDADNVMIFGTKKEGRSGCLEVNNGNNIGYFGGGVLDAYIHDKYALYGTSDDLLVAMGVHRNNPQGGEPYAMVREDLTATSEVTIPGDENVSIYKRGEIDLDAMFFGGGGPPPTISPSFISTISNGTILTMFFDTALFFGAGGSGGFTLNASGGAVTPTYVSGSETLTFTLSRFVAHSETVDVSYTQPGDGLQNGVPIDVASFSTVALDVKTWLAPTTSSGLINDTQDSRKFTPVEISAPPQQNWTEDVAITPIDMNTYLNAGRNSETFITHSWSATGLPDNVDIDQSTGIITGTPPDPVALTSATITCDNQITGDGKPASTIGSVDLPFQVT